MLEIIETPVDRFETRVHLSFERRESTVRKISHVENCGK